MNAINFYRGAYSLIGDATPIDADCGQLCGASCCMGDDETGMYLFPREKEIYRNIPCWLKIEKSNFSYNGKYADIAICRPFCRRNMRPLACRIFPLFPYIKTDGSLSVITDPRAKAVCPLAKVIKINELSPKFVRRVCLLGNIMIQNSEVYGYLFELSRLIDDCCSI